LKARIKEGAEQVIRDMLQPVWQDGGILVGHMQGHERWTYGNSKLLEVD
jgi:hypothetical protein